MIVVQFRPRPAGPLSAETNANGEVTRYQFNAGGDLLSITNAAGVGIVHWDFDTLGRKIIEYDAIRQTRAWIYDGDNRVTDTLTPEKGYTSYSYDQNTTTSPTSITAAFPRHQRQLRLRCPQPGHEHGRWHRNHQKVIIAFYQLGRKAPLDQMAGPMIQRFPPGHHQLQRGQRPAPAHQRPVADRPADQSMTTWIG